MSDENPVSTVLPPHALTLVIGSDTPFLLTVGNVWLVESGHVDVFAVRATNEAPTGGRTHLFRVGAGEPLFGVGTPGDDHGLLAVGAIGTRLRQTSLSEFRGMLADESTAGAALALVERWVDALSAGIARDVLSPRCTELDATGDSSLAAGSEMRSRPQVAWLRHLDGHSELMHEPSLLVNGAGFVPLARRLWVHAPAAVRVSLLRGDALLAAQGPGEIWAGLERLHDLVLRALALAAERAERAHRERLQRRVEASDLALRGACARLVAPLLPRSATQNAGALTETPLPETGRQHPLVAACSLVAGQLGVTIRESAEAEPNARGRDPIDAIARGSRLRTRRVILRDEWWRHEAGPLVAFSASQPRVPLALLPARGGGYEARDTTTGVSWAVTQETQQRVSPVAHTFYRPFPDRALTALDVVRFGFAGSSRDAVTVLGVAVLASLLGMVPAIATGMLFDSIIPGSQRSQLLQVTLVLVAAAVATSLFTLVRGIALLRIEARMSNAIQAAVWDRLLGLPIPFFRPYAAGDLAVRAMSIDNIRQVISGSTLTAVFGGLFSVSNLALMFVYSPSLAWRGLLLILGAIVVAVAGSRLQVQSQRTASNITSHTSGVVLQLLSSVGKLRVAGAEGLAFATWSRWFGQQRAAQYRARTISNWIAAFNATFPTIALMVLFWSAQSLLGAGGLHTGQFLAFLTAFTTTSGALLGTCSAIVGAVNALPLYEQSKPILATPPEVDLAKLDPGELSGEIEVQHLNFRYLADGPPTLRDLSLRIEAGQFVAFVGPSGSGKSTLLRLLLGFETPESGAMYYDGQDLGGLDIQAVRRQIGVVLQNGRLRSGDIFTNIVGSSAATLDDAWEAARMAGFADDVKAMPMGMHTVVSEGGATLSGGQRQRLLIARALVARPRIFFFDEATSALDNRTQAIVSQSLARLQATRVVIAHRLSTIIDADRIFVIERGRLIQSGSYAELMAMPGVFRELAMRQLA